MLDSYIRPLIDPAVNQFGKVFAKADISANAVTITGFSFAIGSFAALVFQFYILALILILISRSLDGIDGAVARNSPEGATDLGAYLDIITDMLFYAGFVFFFALSRPDMYLPALFLLFSFMGTSSTFLTYAILAEKKGFKTEERGKKSFFYLGGLAEGTETLIAFTLICLFPDSFPLIAVIFGIMCWLTTIGRIKSAINDFGFKYVEED
jgi:phosphatidylglycerophosphate synthase